MCCEEDVMCETTGANNRYVIVILLNFLFFLVLVIKLEIAVFFYKFLSVYCVYLAWHLALLFISILANEVAIVMTPPAFTWTQCCLTTGLMWSVHLVYPNSTVMHIYLHSDQWQPGGVRLDDAKVVAMTSEMRTRLVSFGWSVASNTQDNNEMAIEVWWLFLPLPWIKQSEASDNCKKTRRQLLLCVIFLPLPLVCSLFGNNRWWCKAFMIAWETVHNSHKMRSLKTIPVSLQDHTYRFSHPWFFITG